MVDPTEASNQSTGGQGIDFGMIELSSVVAKGTGYRRYLLTAVSLVCFVGLATNRLSQDQAAAVKQGAAQIADAATLLIDGAVLVLGVLAHFLPGLYRLGIKHQ